VTETILNIDKVVVVMMTTNVLIALVPTHMDLLASLEVLMAVLVAIVANLETRATLFMCHKQQ
jgi:TRAP-type C4-dicarboxylate transport system permease large subunit